MDRRNVLRALGAGIGVGLAGCQSRPDEEEEEEEPVVEEDENALVVATVDSVVDRPWPTAGDDASEDESVDEAADDEPPERAIDWLGATFEEEYDAELTWRVPEDGIDHYVRRVRHDAPIEADVFLGLTVDDLVRIDEDLGTDRLFASLERDRLAHDGRVREAFGFGDPLDRAVPYGAEYVCLVFDERVVDAPETLEDLTDPAYEGTVLVPNAQRSRLGRSFFLWTVEEFGRDGYLEYWKGLLENGVRILPDRRESVDAYREGRGSVLVSHSAARVDAVDAELDGPRYRIAFPDGEGYANVGALAVFDELRNPELAYDFVDFVLGREAQSELTDRTRRFPAVADAYVDTNPSFDEYAREPVESVQLAYDDLEGNVSDWLDAWAELIAGG